MLIKVDHCFRSSVMRAVIRKQGVVVLMLIISVAVTAQWSKPTAPQTVGLRLKAFLWKPVGCGPFPAVVFNHGRSNTPQQQYYVV
jgi:hypothetical protein